MKNRSKRILVGKSTRNNAQPELSHEEIAQAIRKFTQSGGLIKRLPAQGDEERKRVGNHLDAAYESVIER